MGKTAGGLGVKLKVHIGTGLTVDAGGATITAGGFTVTAGTSALQDVTATTFAGSDTGDAASKTDGALKTAGGLGVEKKAHIGTGLTVDAGGATITAGGFEVTSGTSALQAVTATTFVGSGDADASDSTTAAVKTAGGLAVAKKVHIGTGL